MFENSLQRPLHAVERREKQTFKVTQLSLGMHKIEFHGNLPLGWAGALAQGLTSRRFNILSGYARRTSMSQWIGELTIEGDFPACGASDIDFNAIINERVEMSHQQIVLSSFSVKECFKANGSIYVEVDGSDQLGFLAGVLKKFMSCSLFPWDFSIRTENGLISDKFHLMGPSGTNASAHMIKLLNTKLKEARDQKH